MTSAIIGLASHNQGQKYKPRKVALDSIYAQFLAAFERYRSSVECLCVCVGGWLRSCVCLCVGGGGVWVHWLGVRGVRGRVIQVVGECISNTLVVLLGLPSFDDTGSLDCPPRKVVYQTSVSTLVITSRFLTGNRKAELKLTTFYSLLLFRVFLSFLFSYTFSDIAP